MEDLYMVKEDVKFKDEELQNLYKCIKSSINKYHNSKHEICFYLYQIKQFFEGSSIYIEYDYGKNKGGGSCFYGFASFCSTFFGCQYNLKTIERYIKVYEKFLMLYNVHFKDYDISKLVELLSLEISVLIEDINNCSLSYKMSKKEILEYVKSKKDAGVPDNKAENSQEEEFNEDDIPMAYNPKQHYEFQYFEQQSKAQLLNIVWELQKEYEKVKRGK